MNILVLSLAGVGNTLLATPAIKSIRQNLREARITLLVSKQVCREVLEGSDYIDEILVFENKKIVRNLAEKLRFILMLRKRKFDVSITVFPSNRIEYNVFAFLIGAKKRITHKYEVGRFSTLPFLQNTRVPAVYGKHDVEQNLKLLRSLGLNPSNMSRKLIMHVTSADKKYAREVLYKNGVVKREIVIGLNPGSAKETKKRWALTKFVELGDLLSEAYGAKLLIFGGPDEEILKQQIFASMNNKPILIEGNLKQTAAVMSRCNLFISNDSGLMHLAVAMGIPTIGIFGPTDPQRTRPWSKKSVIVAKSMPCRPCLKYPIFSTKSRIECQDPKCLKELSVEYTFKILEKTKYKFSKKNDTLGAIGGRFCLELGSEKADNG